MATVQDVRNVDMSDSLSCVTGDRIAYVLATEVPCYVYADAWGTCATLAQSLAAAHIITIALQGDAGTAGPVVSESAGGVSRSYAAPAVTSGTAFWSTSSFGLRFLQLQSTRIASPITVYGDEDFG
jgi:hypothetical protein